jgi:hypothetical protein
MKPKILAASIAAVSLVQVASAADVTIHITGSSAFRGAASNAILNIMTFPSAGMGYAYQGTSFTGATYQIFKGSVAGITGTTTVKTQWSGSVEGIRDVSAPNNIAFLVDTTTVSAGGTPSAPVTTANEPAEIAMADNTQNSTSFKTPAINTVFKVGVVPFAFVAGQNTPTSFTNMTAQIGKALLGAGSIPTSLITGNAADTTPIYAVGRNSGSGTRLTTLAEIGYGTLTPVTQFHPVTQTGNTLNNIDITALSGDDGESSGGNLADILRLNSTSVTDNFNGTGPGLIGMIGYLGENDSYRAVFGIGGSSGTGAGNARYLSYAGVSAFGGVASKPASVTSNGTTTITVVTGSTAGVIPGQIVTGTFIAPGSIVITNPNNGTLILDKIAPAGTSSNVQIGSLLPTAVRQGAYSFWNYEYISWKSAVVTGDKATFAVALKNRILNFDYGFSGLADDASFQVFRDVDGGVIQHK